MNRRRFISSATCLLALAGVSRRIWAASAEGAIAPAGSADPFAHLPLCDLFEARVPVRRIATGRIIHRFFDSCPVSPSGRYVALFRLPNENRAPRPGESGDVVLVDLRDGSGRTVAQSRGWEVQMGANVQWGRTDSDLLLNDVDPDTWTAFGVRLDPVTGATRRLGGTVFGVSPDGTLVSSHNLIRSRRVQVGYGVVLPDDKTPANHGPVKDDGVYVTPIEGGPSRLIASIHDIVEHARPALEIPHADKCEFYCFQTRWNLQGTRLMTFLRWIVPPELRAKDAGPTLALITLRTDGSDIRVAVRPDQYARGGHHPMWAPDGEHITLNLKMREGPHLDIVQVRYDNADLHTLFTPGSGHPSMHSRLPVMITDAYPREPVTRGDGTAPLRLINLETRTQAVVAQVLQSRSETPKLTAEHRIDAHPVWDRTGNFVVFNGVENDTRGVYVADLRELLAG